MLSKEEYNQYNRHIVLPEIGVQGQERLKNAKVLVIGAGGLGCPILQYLTAAGVGTIGIVDGDRVSRSNLQRQVLFSVDDLGAFKVSVAKQRLSSLNPFVHFKTYKTHLSKENALSLFEDYDVIVDASDNFPTRYLINDACVLTNKPLVFGAVFQFEGQVSVFNCQGSGTYRCLFPKPPKADEAPNCSEAGVLGVLPGIIGCFQANEVIKICCELEGVLSDKLVTLNTLTMQQIVIRYHKTAHAQITALANDYASFCGLPQVDEITRAQYESNKMAYHLLDVRTAEERTAFHIGGQHIPLEALETRFSELKTNKPLVVYCRSGNRSKQAIQFLKDKVTVKLINLQGGIG